MEQDDVLQQIKLIAEPWDIGYYGYQVGYFQPIFLNGMIVFVMICAVFWLWAKWRVGAFAERFAGSSDIFKREGRLPHGSLNFITAHDGFTLRDLVSYNHKHNELTAKRTVTDAITIIAIIMV